MTTIWPLPKVDYLPLLELDEPREVALVTSGPAWNSAGSRLRLRTASRFEAKFAEVGAWDAMLPEVKGDVVYAVGGGLAADTAKYLAWSKGLPLVCIPTAISVDAFFTWASGYREDGCVRYLVTMPPDQVIIDLDLIADGPLSIRAAGITDVLSIATGTWDWEYAERIGKNTAATPLMPWVADIARGILRAALECADAAGRGEPDGLKQLLDALALEVQLCNQIGHPRPEEGSEHYFAYAVENIMGKGLPHGDLVGPGILLMADLQGQDTAPLRRALEACHVPLNNIPKDAVAKTLRELPAYCVKHKLAHGLAHDLNEGIIAKHLA